MTVTCVAAGTATCGTNASTGNAISFTSASLAAGAGNQLTLTVSGVVSAAATGDLINTAQVTAGAGETIRTSPTTRPPIPTRKARAAPI